MSCIRSNMMLLPLVVASGCATVKVKIERYALPDESAHPANVAFAAANPKMNTLLDQANAIAYAQDAVRQYLAAVLEFNEIRMQSILTLHQASGNTARAEETTVDLATLKANIPKAFDSVLEAMSRAGMLVRDAMAKDGPKSPGLGFAEPLIEWERLPGRLTEQGPPTPVIPSVGEIEKLKKFHAEDSLKRFLNEGTGGLNKFVDHYGGLRALETQAGKINTLCQSLRAGIGQTFEGLAAHPIGVRSEHVVTENLADPFLNYVARHPEHWRTLTRETIATGDGDGDFVLLFDNRLHPRWRRVKIDPENLVKERLRLGRRMVEMGVATAAAMSGVPHFTRILDPNNEEDMLEGFKELKKKELTGQTLSRKIENTRQLALSQLMFLNPNRPDDGTLNSILRFMEQSLSGLVATGDGTGENTGD